MSRRTRVLGGALVALLIPGGAALLGACWLVKRFSAAGRAEARLRGLLRDVQRLQREGKLPTQPTDEQRASFAWGNVALSYPDGRCPITRDEILAIAKAIPPGRT